MAFVDYLESPYLHGLALIPAWIIHCIHYKMWDEISHPLRNSDGANCGTGKLFHPTFYCQSILGLKSVVIKGAPKHID